MGTQISATEKRETRAGTARVSIVLPTLNEAGSIGATVDRLAAAMDAAGTHPTKTTSGGAPIDTYYEIIIVDDDSPDGTGAIADQIAARYAGRVRVVHRTGKRSLGESVVDGWGVAAGEILVLMDADLQHPPEIIPKLIAEIENGADIAVGSRYVEGGTIGEFGAARKLLSATATATARLASRTVAQVRDPLSGCFAMRRAVIAGRAIHPAGFKVLMEVLRVGKYVSVREVGLNFGRRYAGASQMRAAMVKEDGRLLMRMAWADARAQAERGPKSIPVVLAAIITALLLVTGVRLWMCWHTDAMMDHVSGIWLAAADDLRHGVLYRPPQGELGYGGTRYFPLFISLLAAAWRVAGDWRVAAYALSLGTVLLLLGGVYAVLRRCGATRFLATAGAAAVLAGINTQEALLMIRADALAAALNLWGVALVIPHLSLQKRERQMWGTFNFVFAAAAFALAFAAKMTTVFGAVAVVAAFALSGRRRQALQLGAGTLLGYAAVVGATLRLGGRAFLDTLQVTASAGTTISYFVSSPLRLLDLLRQSTGDGLFFIAAGVCLILSHPFAPKSGANRVGHPRVSFLPNILFVITLAATLVILGSPGTNRNHLIDLYAASVIACLGWLLAKPRRMALGMAVFAILLGVATNASYVAHRYQDGTDNRRLRARVLESIGSPAGPVLSENPLFPLMAGQRPYLLDPFMLRVIDARRPHWGDRLREDLARRKFAVVVLEHHPRSDPRWFEKTHFGDWFVPLLEANYEAVARPGYLVVYKPRR